MLAELAEEKIMQEYENFSGDRYEAIMKNSVKEALLNFCKQDEEFAQAVYQGGEFKDCMAEVAKGVGRGISDIEAYKRAVNYYFKGADIEFKMAIKLCPSEEEKPKKEIVLDLEDFI